MPQSKQAALGFRVHSGWAAMVAVCLEHGAPIVLARRRARLVANFSYTFRQPYHTAEKMAIAEAREFVASVRDESARLALHAIRELQEDTHQQGANLTHGALLLASGRALPELEKILASHALIHTADGELFRDALAQASKSRKLKMFRVKEKELLAQASMILAAEPAALMKRITALGKSVGSPWSQDEKFATLAAWLALRAKQSAS